MPSSLQFHLNGGHPVAMSIPATEHSVMTSWRTEQAAMENMMEQFGTGLYAIVMDSYDYAEVDGLSVQWRRGLGHGTVLLAVVG